MDAQQVAKELLNDVGNTLIIGVPIGIGKPIYLLNVLYEMACANLNIKLTIITGLTLARPAFKPGLEQSFAEPILQRLTTGYVDPLYELDRRRQALPSNVTVIEFFLTPGNYLHNRYVQSNYISSIYTDVVKDTLVRQMNVLAQQVVILPDDASKISLSSNTDLFSDAAKGLMFAREAGKKIAIVGEQNAAMPVMLGSAVVDKTIFTHFIDQEPEMPLFPLPRDRLSQQDHMIGAYASTLIQDDSCLQIGIGKLGNALANALIMRQNSNEDYVDFIKTLGCKESLPAFNKGIYASTEMMSDEYLQLFKHQIVKKCVYDDIALQNLLNQGKITAQVSVATLDHLIQQERISALLSLSDFLFLQHFGIFKSDLSYSDGFIETPNEKLKADLISNRDKITQHCLGETLKNGKAIHAGFCLGSQSYYHSLRAMPLAERELIDMTSISRTNSLEWNPALLALQRQHARFFNTSLMICLNGSVVSDCLEDSQVISGVGGQFDFVMMGNKLNNARSIIACRSTRQTKAGIKSNIVWDYPACTIPRFLRDIFITEYGIADCGSKTDSETIKALLNITDSRFQPSLLAKAKRAGKIELAYQIPDEFCHNYPDKYHHTLADFQARGYFNAYPFGSDFTPDEQVLERALSYLKFQSIKSILSLLMQSLFLKNKKENDKYLDRLNLSHPKSWKDHIYKKLISVVLQRQSQAD